MNPENTVFDAKRMIGRTYSEIKNELKYWPFKVVPGDQDKPLIEINYMDEIKKSRFKMDKNEKISVYRL